VAALLELGWYIPLATISKNVYDQQHDIGYLEGAAFIEYLVETYDFDDFNNFTAPYMHW
jgi:hypothetical protein